jgi:hypothetical protein
MFTAHFADFKGFTSEFEVHDRLRRPFLILVRAEMFKKTLGRVCTSVSNLNLNYAFLTEYLLLTDFII